MPQKVASLNETYPTDCPVLLKVRSDYADWSCGTHKGYIRYHQGITHQIYEHQLVASYGYGVPLSNKMMHVHHLNENRHDNRFSNLAYLTSSEHGKAHDRNPNRVPCNNCGQMAKRSPAVVKSKKYIFCSRSCYIHYINNVHHIGAGTGNRNPI